jgi:hypothetical protein
MLIYLDYGVRVALWWIQALLPVLTLLAVGNLHVRTV